MAAARVVFLGSGDAFFAGGRHQAGYLVQRPEGVSLLDCGASTLTSMKQHGIDTAQIDQILISHLHGDHFAGIPFFLLEYTYERARQRPLRIAGPPGTEERVRGLFSIVYRELAAHPLPFPLEFVDMLPNVPLVFGDLRIEPFRVPHQETEISLGFSLNFAGRRIVYSGDTGWTEELITRSQGADLFICECSYFDTRQPFHIDYPRLAAHRSRFSAKRMILTHLGRETLARRNEIEMELASDGLTVEIA